MLRTAAATKLAVISHEKKLCFDINFISIFFFFFLHFTIFFSFFMVCLGFCVSLLLLPQQTFTCSDSLTLSQFHVLLEAPNNKSVISLWCFNVKLKLFTESFLGPYQISVDQVGFFQE